MIPAAIRKNRITALISTRWAILFFAVPLFLTTLTSTVSAQVVQLPTICTFGTQGTVLVPDRGSISLGSVNRAAIGSSSRGLPIVGGGFRSIGGYSTHTGASVHATIIDFDALDRETLAKAQAAQYQRNYRNTRGTGYNSTTRRSFPPYLPQ